MTGRNGKATPLGIDLLQYKGELNIRSSDEEHSRVFDPLRKDWFVLSPEEFVRQLLVRWLIAEGIGAGRISLEREMNRKHRRERYDLLVLDKKGSPWLLAECKSFRVRLGQSVFEQSSRYNRQLRVPFQMITNGRRSFLCEINYEEDTYSFRSTFPSQ